MRRRLITWWIKFLIWRAKIHGYRAMYENDAQAKIIDRVEALMAELKKD